MTITRTKTVATIAAAAVVLAVAARWEGAQNVATDGGCEKLVSYTANWGGTGRAQQVEWGIMGSLEREADVRKPWQKINVKVPCGKIVTLHVQFTQATPGVLCAITANNEVHQSTPGGKTYSCFEQTIVY